MNSKEWLFVLITGVGAIAYILFMPSADDTPTDHFKDLQSVSNAKADDYGDNITAAEYRFWGKIDSKIDWCESNHQFSKYIAEPMNTITGTVFIFISIFLFEKYGKYFKSQIISFDVLFLVFTLSILGIATIAFHATLKYSMQLFDELSMCCLTTSMCILLYFQSSFYHCKYDSYDAGSRNTCTGTDQKERSNPSVSDQNFRSLQNNQPKFLKHKAITTLKKRLNMVKIGAAFGNIMIGLCLLVFFTNDETIMHNITHHAMTISFAFGVLYIGYTVRSMTNTVCKDSDSHSSTNGKKRKTEQAEKTEKMEKMAKIEKTENGKTKEEKRKQIMVENFGKTSISSDWNEFGAMLDEYYGHALFWFLFSSGLWLFDNLGCDYLRNLPFEIPYLQLHALGWHLGSCMMLYYLILFIVVHRFRVVVGVKMKQMRIDSSFFGLLPYVAIVDFGKKYN